MWVPRYRWGWPCNGTTCRRRSRRPQRRRRPGLRWMPRWSRNRAPCWTWRRRRRLRPLAAADDDDAPPRRTRRDTCWTWYVPPVRWTLSFLSAGDSNPSDSANCAAVRNWLPRPPLQPRIDSILGSQWPDSPCTPGCYLDSRSRTIVAGGIVGT